MCKGVIVPRYSSKEEKVAKAATVPPGWLADHRRNKPELCIPGISADRCLRQNLWRLELFGPAGLLPLPQRATSQMKRRLFCADILHREHLRIGLRPIVF